YGANHTDVNVGGYRFVSIWVRKVKRLRGQPEEPYLAKKLGFDTLWFGYLQTTVGIIQLLGGPMFGRFADLFGARLALSLACSSTVVFFLLLAIADHPAMLFIHKIPTIFMHVLPASQMVVTDLSEPDKRADALSKLGLCFGVGMIAGSTLGGHLNTRFGLSRKLLKLKLQEPTQKKSTGKMEGSKKVTFEDEKDSQKTGPMSAYHQYVLSSILPDTEREYNLLQKKNQTLERENTILKKKVDDLMTDAKQLKAEQQRIHQVINNRDTLRSQLVVCKNELSVMGKKIKIQTTELKRCCKQNEDLKVEMESMKKALHSVKHGSVKQRAEQQKLKEQLDQAVKERVGLSLKWQQCRNQCSVLRDKVSEQESSLSMKSDQCKEHIKQIHLLRQENLKQEKEKVLMESDAKDQRQRLRRCEEELRTQNQKLQESEICRAVENQMGKRIVILKQRNQMFRNPPKDVHVQKIESLQKELLAQSEDLRKALKQCEELKQNLTQVSVQLSECQAKVRGQKDKLKALTGERNMYRSKAEKLSKQLADIKKVQHAEKLSKQLADIKKVQHAEKLQRSVAKRPKKVNLASGDKTSTSCTSCTSCTSRTSHPSSVPKKSGGKLKLPHLCTVSREVQEQTDLRIIGTKI
ncbi:hypothetical protein INR49_020055, partial [Caranx melampygus]